MEKFWFETVKQDKKGAKEKYIYLNDEFSMEKENLPEEILLFYLVHRQLRGEPSN